ncbi:MAG: PP2C family protein-serine/threonine phosphatase [Phycisphaerae bacterium]
MDTRTTYTSPATPQRDHWLRGTWKERLDTITSMVRAISLQSDPGEMVRFYRDWIRSVMPMDGSLSLTRRDHDRPHFRITRIHDRDDTPDPWRERDQLPVFSGGLLAELIYTGEPVIIDDFCVSPSDPAAAYLTGFRSLMATPLFDQGRSLNMVVALMREPNGFNRERLPEQVWMSNLFGRATQALVLGRRLKEAYEQVDRELKVVADIQRSLLPREKPKVPGLELATYYRTSKHAGGDYYDFFELPGGKVGILVADVSGHGTPAAVMMAVTHAIAHSAAHPDPPCKMMRLLNERLFNEYTRGAGTFVTAFYGIYDPANRRLTYCSAGHNPPRVKKPDGHAADLAGDSRNLPLGIDPFEAYTDHHRTLEAGDILVIYTDGITEARVPGTSDMFGPDRLDDVLANCPHSAQCVIDATVRAIDAFTDGVAPTDDRTMIVAKLLPA